MWKFAASPYVHFKIHSFQSCLPCHYRTVISFTEIQKNGHVSFSKATTGWKFGIHLEAHKGGSMSIHFHTKRVQRTILPTVTRPKYKADHLHVLPYLIRGGYVQYSVHLHDLITLSVHVAFTSDATLATVRGNWVSSVNIFINLFTYTAWRWRYRHYDFTLRHFETCRAMEMHRTT
jgi:hypothetical protein